MNKYIISFIAISILLVVYANTKQTKQILESEIENTYSNSIYGFNLALPDDYSDMTVKREISDPANKILFYKTERKLFFIKKTNLVMWLNVFPIEWWDSNEMAYGEYIGRNNAYVFTWGQKGGCKKMSTRFCELYEGVDNMMNAGFTVFNLENILPNPNNTKNL